LEDSQGIVGVSEDFQGCLRDLEGFLWISGGFFEGFLADFQGFSRKFKDFQGFLRISKDFQGLPRIFKDYLGSSRIT